MGAKKTRAELEAELEDLQRQLRQSEDEKADLKEEVTALKSKISQKEKFISTADIEHPRTVLHPKSGGMILVGEDGNPKIIGGKK